MVDHVLFRGCHLDGLHRAEEFADEAGHIPGSLTGSAAIVFDTLGRDIRDDPHGNQRQQRHHRDPRADPNHKNNGYDDNPNSYSDVVNEDHKQGYLIDIVLETADGFTRRVRQRRGARSAQDMSQQVLAQQRGNIGKDGDIRIVKAVAGDHAPDP